MKKTLATFFLLSAFTVIAFAQGTTGNPGDTGGTTGNPGGTGGTAGNDILSITNPIGADSIQDLLATILRAIVQIAIPFLVLAIMYVGFLFVLARGNPEKLAQARQALFYTLLGALIILGAQTLSIILSGTINQLTNPN